MKETPLGHLNALAGLPLYTHEKAAVLKSVWVAVVEEESLAFQRLGGLAPECVIKEKSHKLHSNC